MSSPENNINRNLGVSTSPIVEWQDPYIHTPPSSSKVLLLSWDNIQLEGTWGKNGHLDYAAWAPKPARQDWLKARMYKKYIGQFSPLPVGN